jgi:hypothetical protein
MEESVDAGIPESVNAVLFEQVFDRELLLPVEQPGDHQDHELKRERNLRHGPIVAASPRTGNSTRPPDR